MKRDNNLMAAIMFFSLAIATLIICMIVTEANAVVNKVNYDNTITPTIHQASSDIILLCRELPTKQTECDIYKKFDTVIFE